MIYFLGLTVVLYVDYSRWCILISLTYKSRDNGGQICVIICEKLSLLDEKYITLMWSLKEGLRTIVTDTMYQLIVLMVFLCIKLLPIYY